MRRFDKKKNIEKVNLLSESRHLNRGTIKEGFHEADGTPIVETPEAPEELVRSLINIWTTEYKYGVPSTEVIDYDIGGENFGDYELNLIYGIDTDGNMELSYTVTFTITQTGSPSRASLEEPEEYLEWEIGYVNIKDIEFKDNINKKTYTSTNNDLYAILHKNANIVLKDLESQDTIPNFVDGRY
jgi:metal-sulfur cluster biosynthetic enzyme